MFGMSCLCTGHQGSVLSMTCRLALQTTHRQLQSEQARGEPFASCQRTAGAWPGSPISRRGKTGSY